MAGYTICYFGSIKMGVYFVAGYTICYFVIFWHFLVIFSDFMIVG